MTFLQIDSDPNVFCYSFHCLQSPYKILEACCLEEITYLACNLIYFQQGDNGTTTVILPDTVLSVRADSLIITGEAP